MKPLPLTAISSRWRSPATEEDVVKMKEPKKKTPQKKKQKNEREKISRRAKSRKAEDMGNIGN